MSLIVETVCIVVLAVVIRGVFPRFRIDQIEAKHWKWFIFLYIFLVLELLIGFYFLVWKLV